MSLSLHFSLDGRYMTFQVQDPIEYSTLQVTPTVERALQHLVESGIPIAHPDLETRLRNSLQLVGLLYRDHPQYPAAEGDVVGQHAAVVVDPNAPRLEEQHVPQVRALLWNALKECGLTNQPTSPSKNEKEDVDDDCGGAVWLNLNSSFLGLFQGNPDHSNLQDVPWTDEQYQFGRLYFKAQYPHVDFAFEQKVAKLQQAVHKEQWLAEEAQSQWLQQQSQSPGRVGAAVQMVRLRRTVKTHTARAAQLEQQVERLLGQQQQHRGERLDRIGKASVRNNNNTTRGHEPPVPVFQPQQSNPVITSSKEVTPTAISTSHFIPEHLLASSSKSASSQPQPQTQSTITNTGSTGVGGSSRSSTNHNHPLIEAILRAKSKQNSTGSAAAASAEESQSSPRDILEAQQLHSTPLVQQIQQPAAAVASLSTMDRSGARSREYADGGGGGGDDSAQTPMTAMDSSSSPPLQIFAASSDDARSVDTSAVTHQTIEKAAGPPDYGDKYRPTAAAVAGSNPYRVSSPAERLQRKEQWTYRSQRYRSFRERLQQLIRIVRTDHQQQLASNAARRQTLQELGTWVEDSPLETKTNFRSKVYSKIDQLSSIYSKKYESNIVDMVVRWEASAASQLKAEIKSAKSIYSTLDHYEEKVVSLQQKYTRQPAGTDAAQNLWNKLERNQQKLQEAAAEYLDCCDRLDRLDKTIEYAWMLIFPLLVKFLQTDMDEAKERASVMALLEDSLREMTEAVQQHGLDPHVALNSLEMWSFLYTNGIAAVPASLKDVFKEAGVASANAGTMEREMANVQETSSAFTGDYTSIGSVSNQHQQPLGSDHDLARISSTIQQQTDQLQTLQSSDEDREVAAMVQSVPAVAETVELGESSVPTDNPWHQQKRIPVDPSVIVIRDEILPAYTVDEVESASTTTLYPSNAQEHDLTGNSGTNQQPQQQTLGSSEEGFSVSAEKGAVVMGAFSLPMDALINNDDNPQHHEQRIPVDPSVIVIRDKMPPTPNVDEVNCASFTVLGPGNTQQHDSTISTRIIQQPQHLSDEDRGVGSMAQDMSVHAPEGSVEMGGLSLPTSELMSSNSVIILGNKIPPVLAVDQVEPERQSTLDAGIARVAAASGTETTDSDSSPWPNQQRQPIDASVIGITAENPPVLYQCEPLTRTTSGPSDALGDNKNPKDMLNNDVVDPKHPGGEESFVVLGNESHDDGSLQPMGEAGSDPSLISLPSIEAVGEGVGNQIDLCETNDVAASFLEPSLEINAATKTIVNHSTEAVVASASIGGIESGFERDAIDCSAFHDGVSPTSNSAGGCSTQWQHKPYTDGAETLFDFDAEGINEFLSDVCAVGPTVGNGSCEKVIAEEPPDIMSQMTENVRDRISDYKENIAGHCKTEEVHMPKRGGDPPADDEFIQYCYESDDDGNSPSCHTEPELLHHQPVFSDPELLDYPSLDLRPVDNILLVATEVDKIVDADVNGNGDDEFDHALNNATNERADYLKEPKNQDDADADDFADVLGAAALVEASDSLIISEFHSASEVDEGSRIGYLC